MNWLIHSNAGLATRIGVGSFIFLCLAIVDLKRNKTEATRWREYFFLLACVAAAMVYGVLNDQITSSISWEYFYYGKELEAALGPDIPPAAGALHWQAAKIGMMATWWIGLLLGAVMLMANNPRAGRPRVSYRRMLGMLPAVVGIAIGFGIVGGIAGALGWLNWASADFGPMWQSGMFRPRRFIGVWGVHLGGYVGGILGACWAIFRVLHDRRMMGLRRNSATDYPVC